MRLKAGVLLLFEQPHGARPYSNSNSRAGQQVGFGGTRLGPSRDSGLPWQGQGWGSCTVPICPRLLRWWEVPQLAGGMWEKAVPPGSLS